MLIHVATDNDIYPPLFGGSQRTFGLCRGMARRHDVHALCVVPNRSTGAQRERADGVSLIRRREWYTSFAWRLDRMGIAPIHVGAIGHRARAAGMVRSLPGTAEVFAADLMLTPLFERHSAPLRLYLAQNVELDRFRSTHPALARSSRWSAYVRDLEARALERSTLIVACTAEDADRFGELYGAPRERIVVIPNGWDDLRVRIPSPELRVRSRAALGFGGSETVAIFVGSDMPHNREAVRSLVSEVMPAIGAEGFRLVVAGSVCRSLEGAREPWLRLAHEVADLEPWLHASDVGLNPVRSGAGSNVKLPTYLAAGLAVVTTGFGLRGYPELAPLVHVASVGETAAALRERPRGWAAQGLAMPAAVAALAWGTLGESLGDRLTAALPAGRAATLQAGTAVAREVRA